MYNTNSGELLVFLSQTGVDVFDEEVRLISKSPHAETPRHTLNAFSEPCPSRTSELVEGVSIFQLSWLPSFRTSYSDGVLGIRPLSV